MKQKIGFLDRLQRKIRTAIAAGNPEPAPKRVTVELAVRNEKKEARRISDVGTMARLWDRSMFEHEKITVDGVEREQIKVGRKDGKFQYQAFKTYDGTVYFVHSSGAFVNGTRDRRPPKVRKRERRAAREAREAAAAIAARAKDYQASIPVDLHDVVPADQQRILEHKNLAAAR